MLERVPEHLNLIVSIVAWVKWSPWGIWSMYALKNHSVVSRSQTLLITGSLDEAALLERWGNSVVQMYASLQFFSSMLKRVLV